MKISERQIEQKLHIAEHEEAMDTDQQFYSDLRGVFSQGGMEEGVELRLGSDLARLTDVLTKLGLADVWWNRGRGAHVHNIVVSSGATKSFVGAMVSETGNTDIPTTLVAAQADHWSVGLRSATYPFVQAESDEISSRIILANSIYGADDGPYADLSSVGVCIGLSTRYIPNFDDVRRGLGYFFRDVDSEHGRHPRNVAGPVLAELSLGQSEILMPSSNYWVAIGPLCADPNNPLGSIEGVVVESVFTVHDGRIVRVESS